MTTGPWFNIKMSSYQYRKSHCGDKTVVRSSYLHNGISYTGKMASLYWISPQVPTNKIHYNNAIMIAMASQTTSLAIAYSNIYSGTDQRKHQSSASLAFVRGIQRRSVNSPHEGPVTRKMFPFDDAIMYHFDGLVQERCNSVALAMNCNAIKFPPMCALWFPCRSVPTISQSHFSNILTIDTP